jgi:hypothetical protein
MMNYLYLERLKSTSVLRGEAPWKFKPATPFPAGILGSANKKARGEWANSLNTVSNFYTGYEGLNSSGRIRVGKGEESNPPVKEHFLVADFDCPTPVEQALERANKFNPRPNYLERTMSGNWRAVWLLEKPINIPSLAWAKFFKEKFAKYAFNLENLLPGLDKSAWEAPERFFTNSGEWYTLHEEPIPAERVSGWEFLASKDFNWKKNAEGLAIPAEVVGPELEKKFPRFADWPGEFVVGSQGPTFWVADSTSPKSAIVRDTGMQTFSDHAIKGFYTWTELLGGQFTRDYEADFMGRAVENIFFDSKDYWVAEENRWRVYNKADTIQILKVNRGVSDTRDKSGISDTDKAIRFVQQYNRIEGAVPLVCRRPGLVTLNQNRLLNTLTTTFLAAAPGAQVWGPTGSFPFISNFLEKLFDRGNPQQLQNFLSWLALFYRSGLYHEPTSGLCAVFAGAAGTGKTYLTQGIIGGLVGGHAEATKYLAGKNEFGSENYYKALWVVDDAESAADPVEHKRFSEGLKRAVANDSALFHEKYRVPVSVSWFGRVVICLNKDADSLRVIPDLDISIQEKISLYHTADETIEFPIRKVQDEITARELPFFAAFLRDFVVPDCCVGKSRFGVRYWHDPEIYDRAKAVTPSATFAELLDCWRGPYFTHTESTAEFWEGTALAFHSELATNKTLEHVLREYKHNTIGKHLSALSSQPDSGVTHRILSGKKLYCIERPKDLPFPPGGKN